MGDALFPAAPVSFTKATVWQRVDQFVAVHSFGVAFPKSVTAIPVDAGARLDIFVSARELLAAGQLEVMFDHHLHEAVEVDLGAPAEGLAGLGGIPE